MCLGVPTRASTESTGEPVGHYEEDNNTPNRRVQYVEQIQYTIESLSECQQSFIPSSACLGSALTIVKSSDNRTVPQCEDPVPIIWLQSTGDGAARSHAGTARQCNDEAFTSLTKENFREIRHSKTISLTIRRLSQTLRKSTLAVNIKHIPTPACRASSYLRLL
ncbi:hypothetical protein Tco_1264221 [Tanacetum coccineum]